MSGKLANWLSNQQDCWSRVVIPSEWEGSVSQHCLLLLSFSGRMHCKEPPATLQLRECPRAESQELLDGKGWERSSWGNVGEQEGLLLNPSAKWEHPHPFLPWQDCLKYLYFPSRCSWISLNSHLPLGIKFKFHLFPPAPINVPCSILWMPGSLYWIQH